jgi:BNR/Asp-box repeat
MRFSVVVAAAVATVAATAATAPGATTYTPGSIVTASTPASPFVDPCPAQAENPPDQVNYKDTEVEPLVAVNPTNQDNVLGVYQQDRWSDGGAHGLLAATSFTGGSSYNDHSWAEFSACSIDDPSETTAEHLPRATDPWVSFDSAGRAYQIGLSIIDGSLTGESALSTSVSDDGGVSWSSPSQIIRIPGGVAFLDKQSITADPYNANRAWATWIQGNLPGENISFAKLSHAFSYRGTPMISRTTDGGGTWSTPKPMTNANLYAQGNQIVVLPNGTLVDVQAILFKGSGIQPAGNGVYMAVMRSRDGGKTWSAPSKIAPIGTVAESADGKALRVGDYLPDLAVDPSSGALYVTWADGLGGSTNKIVLSRSTDGGQHWTAPMIVSHHNSAQSFNDAVAVGNDGEVGLIYYDDNDNTSAAGIPTDVYFRHSGNGGATWSSPQKLATFDFATAPVARGLFVGDYQGLAAIGPKDFLAFFGVTDNNPESANVTSIRLAGS